MFKVELHNNRPDADPAPCFATTTEIEIAERLRHQLEKRFLAPSAPHSSSTAPSSEMGDELAAGAGGAQQGRDPS